MMIGLANLDGSFTMTLFMPKAKFSEMTNPEEVMQFFHAYFPDSIPLFGEDYLRNHYFDWEPLPLCYIKVDPYFYGENAVLVGDSAHAIVPFYGQGLNAGLESVLILNQLIEHNKGDIGLSIKQYSDRRVEDGQAIADMALYNYWVMRDGVNSRWFRFKKNIYSVLNLIVPSRVTPIYTLVSFTQERYSVAWKKHHKMEKNVSWITGGLVVAVVGGAAAVVVFGLSEFDLKLPKFDFKFNLGK